MNRPAASQRGAYSGRFIALLLVVSGLAFLVGTRALLLRSNPSHPITGRTIAGMATNGAWMERPDRAGEESPDRALALIGIARGATVADVGAGTGYMTSRISAMVGPAGRVFATEIQPDMLRLIRERVRNEHLENVEIVAGTVDDARLPPAAIDVALLVDVYHELQRPQAMLHSIRRSLKVDGRLVVIEYRLEDPRLPIAPTHRMSVAALRSEIEPEGFRLDALIEELPRQHIAVFGMAQFSPGSRRHEEGQ